MGSIAYLFLGFCVSFILIIVFTGLYEDIKELKRQVEGLKDRVRTLTAYAPQTPQMEITYHDPSVEKLVRDLNRALNVNHGRSISLATLAALKPFLSYNVRQRLNL